MRRRGCLTPSWWSSAQRRRFTAKYKLGILRAGGGAVRLGEIGELLRREGLYTSHLTYWRKQRDDGALRELGRPAGASRATGATARSLSLLGGLRAPRCELAKARRVIEIQGNVSALLEEMLGTESDAEEHRAMIAATVEELTPIIGTRPACRALGASVATIYRRRRPAEPTTSPATADAGQGAERGRAPDGAWPSCTRSGSSTSRPRGDLRDAAGRGHATWLRRARCTGCSPPGMVACGSDAISSPTRRMRSPSCWLSGRTSCGRGMSRSCRARRSGRGSTCT